MSSEKDKHDINIGPGEGDDWRARLVRRGDQRGRLVSHTQSARLVSLANIIKFIFTMIFRQLDFCQEGYQPPRL